MKWLLRPNQTNPKCPSNRRHVNCYVLYCASQMSWHIDLGLGFGCFCSFFLTRISLFVIAWLAFLHTFFGCPCLLMRKPDSKFQYIQQVPYWYLLACTPTFGKVGGTKNFFSRAEWIVALSVYTTSLPCNFAYRLNFLSRRSWHFFLLLLIDMLEMYHVNVVVTVSRLFCDCTAHRFHTHFTHILLTQDKKDVKSPLWRFEPVMVKLPYDTRRLVSLMANAFNRLGQYAISRGNRTYVTHNLPFLP